MVEPVFIKCEPSWSSDTEEKPLNFEQNAILPSANHSKLKEELPATVADPTLERINIKVDKQSCSDEDEIKVAYDEEFDNSGGSSSTLNNASGLTGRSVHSCDMCGKTFGRRSKLQLHLETHIEIRLYQCGICNCKFTLRGLLDNHMLTHPETTPLRCSTCGMTFRHKSNIAGKLEAGVEAAINNFARSWAERLLFLLQKGCQLSAEPVLTHLSLV
ncbi:zinc finger protein 710-like [Anabrus simplex]|uniref:zinc finger protein 710-like n=1 Tax=Anabrus simplex TaxID=316456 RepID=UPI0035A36C82